MKNGGKGYLFFALFIIPIMLLLISLCPLIFVSAIGESSADYINEVPWEKTLLVISVILLIIAIIIYSVIIKKWKKEELLLQQALLDEDISQLDSLDPYEFEEWIARFLRIQGYNANCTKKSGDYGIDVLAEKDGLTIGIQCKKFTTPVGIKAIQETISGMTYYDCEMGWVISTAPYFTQAAKNLAEKQNIQLYNKNDLAKWHYEVKQNNLKNRKTNS